ncbi:MAG TPA: ATP-binding protein [Bryobacteraceae bacterium]|jgi:PAS domain S-box-containing protein
MNELRRYRFAVLLTIALGVLIPVWAGWPHGWVASLSLIAVILAIWALDPPLVALAVGGIGLLFPLISKWVPLDSLGMPSPLMVWLSIAVVYLLRIELKVREDMARKDAELLADRQEQEEWRALFENSPAAILTADGEGRVVMGNPAARTLLGCEDRPIRGMGIAQSVAALGAALRIDRKKALFHNLTGCTGWRPNGEMFVADAWFSIHETSVGTRLGAVVVDATERLQDRARGGLRSSMATSQIAMGAVLHEIRNLSAAATLMYNNLIHAEMAHPAGLQENADFEALGTLLKALASLASAELRPGEGSYSSVSLADVLAQLRMVIDPWFNELEMTVKWDIAPDLPNVWGEESGLLQLFLNLAQNSNKAMLACEERQMNIEARVEADWVTIRFRDTGPGIANPDELFEPFRRSTGIRGLGLFVSRAIAHSFHGELKHIPVESGSCFQVELLPLREWQKVTGPYENAGIQDPNPPR